MAEANLDRSDALKIAAVSGADLRTVARFFAGRAVKRSTGRAIEMAMRELGITDPRVSAETRVEV